ncbi:MULTISPECIES: threonine-phosphate decarboxylase CobD [Pelosinus]|uniref:threonine-phosphate decarboxylase n=1 Tax=Pelosinus fermentans B4 TaxID=1149862 RepID=I9LDU9_9FIRM|nr:MULTISPECIES: threonine-phosphate decarboxylase CobD [Pelosinus]EIW18526.1 L-threonine-O-3-phosphate decarboxylase [Pelosinus fermentans B4]EIW24540.1 L-threonine-O-3-phosphate decarboxylase [Pelosinus fermentans A11]OAM94402.1 L-threonine-O-3-phosphate decarboxylase [Pelosinus fermentans DSM 17108]SDR08180.1 L-threonine O-3-phosphate decarboxylase [Pelosinus fermentans]
MSGLNVFEHGGNLYAKMRETGGGLSEILDFSANINPLGISDKIRQTLHESLESIIHYPDAQGYALKNAISQHYQVDSASITIGNGAVELMYILCHMLAPKRVLVTAPTFSEYECAARASGANIEYFYLDERDNFEIDIEKLTKRLTDIDVIFICNPNNPTGTLLTNKQLEKLLEVARIQNTYVVIDESFIDFLPNAVTYTCRHLLTQYENLIILHSLTKFYAIPGLRLGFSLASPRITMMLHAGKDPWNVNTLAQNAGVVALSDNDYQRISQDYVAEAKIELYNNLLAIKKLKPYLPSVNFILINIKETAMTAKQLRNTMEKHNILIRDCSNYPGLSSEYIRVAVKQKKQNYILVDTLKRLLGGI